MKGHKTVDAFIANSAEWQESLRFLRELLSATELEETIKWGIPVYALGKKNVVGMSAFKSYVGLWFYQGALLKDKGKKLINAQEGITKALRQWRFQSLAEIQKETETIKQYLAEAIANQKAGKEIKPTKKAALVISPELLLAFEAHPGLKEAFGGLTMGKQRDYVEHIDSAKQETTKQRRLDKIIPMILEGKGLNDKYL